ncbi:NADP-specific glutamate dehydrogenase [Sphingobacterium psychroaquaticum]|uniref:Glutamate dehydrogenase n=1 Tax=Sphingobacterium psychroaquaticum TaxID=561061 RepID=A0A1X7IIS6_9SPHI|nr:NADP-specific glutamate dehydrogenase [Sphingobacterium psychroaquaticum]QBQ41502.1 NADP-specific glutamate dehydrogenase [Sphingobacterium psychroaquaticum]SMG14371.1 glutamate dehydrogenase (NADP+) [Sphingobacterium psychroaquaticum]
MSLNFKNFIKHVADKNPNEPEFLQAVAEVTEDLIPYINERHPTWKDLKILERIVEPERVISFRVTWLDDNNEVQVNRGYRVQMNSAIGPYKGGLRFSPTVNLSILKFLAFEQVFKNSLTGIPLGGGKGGSDFDPKGKSDMEIMRFCQSFMTELYRHVGAETDVPAGDIGVGEREVGYMFGQYKRIQNNFTGVLTGKGKNWGGSYIRPEATGYGLLYFVQCILESLDDDFNGKTITISGAGNVAYYAAEKAIHLGGKVITLSNSTGCVHDPDGFTIEKLTYINTLGRNISDYPKKFKSASFYADKKPWHFPCDIALPCATQNELDGDDAKILIKNGCKFVAEGANMPSTADAIKAFHKGKVYFAPGKAANAGGVAVSGLEMSQNWIGQQWPSEKVDAQLKGIMENIHKTCIKYGREEDGHVNYLKGANIGGFIKVASAMKAQGLV